MLSSYILLAFVLLEALAVPVGAFLAFRAGYRCGRAVREDRPQMPKVLSFAAGGKETHPEQERVNRILANIDRYDGTNQGQEAIE